MHPKTIGFHHFGCKVNFAEGSTISRQFQEKGYKIVDFRDVADIYVINTCVVTAVAEKKCRAAIRQVHRRNPLAKIAVIGCFPELKSEEIQKIKGVSVVLGHSAKFRLPEEIERLELKEQFRGHDHDEESQIFIPSFSFGDRTRSFLKIQDGCDYYCAYCTIPFARGKSRSETIDHTVDQVREISRSGVREIILTGVNIGDFGKNNGETFLELLLALKKLKELPRIRISSIEPDLLNDDIIDLIAGSEKFMPHFHIPLQSGSDQVLKSMKRKYNTGLFSSRIEKIRSVLPNACIASDIIAGFPGETEQNFNDTVSFLEKQDISYLHVFTYSKRENTVASRIGNDIQDKVKKERSEILQTLSGKKKRKFYEINQDREVQVLFESDNSEGWMHGFTGNYIKVKTRFDPELVNKVVPLKLTKLDDDMTFIHYK